jgi:multiple sugar transport system permease protein
MASAKKTILGLDLNTWVFLLPALLFFAGYQLFPIVRVVWISFTDFKYLTNDPPNWVC